MLKWRNYVEAKKRDEANHHENKKQIDALKKMLEKWEAMFKDSFQKWKDTKDKLELINANLAN